MTGWRAAISGVCGGIAAAFLAGMMLLTVADVVLRSTLGTPIRGVYELIELLLTGTFFIALPCVFLRNEDIVVNSIDEVAPRWVPVLKRIAAIITVVILALMAWRGWISARDSFEFNDVTADLGIPRFYHWTAVLVGLVGAGIATLVMAVSRNGRP